MAKVFGLGGNVSGRAGSYVFRVRGGKTIMSQYNPIVKNPDSKSQSDQRAKFKLLTQLGATLRGAYGFGTISVAKRKTRPSQNNIFFSVNYNKVAIAGEKASVDLTQLQLTNGKASLTTTPIQVASGSNSIEVTVSDIIDNINEIRIVVLQANRDREGFSVIGNEVLEIDSSREVFSAFPTPLVEPVTVYVYGYIIPENVEKRLNDTESEVSGNVIKANVAIQDLVQRGEIETTTTVSTSFLFA